MLPVPLLLPPLPAAAADRRQPAAIESNPRFFSLACRLAVQPDQLSGELIDQLLAGLSEGLLIFVGSEPALSSKLTVASRRRLL